MKTKITATTIALTLLALSTINSPLSTALAQGTAFTYQGQLQNNGSPANGTYDLTFTLYNASSGGIPLGGPLTNSATGVTNGLFTTTLNFGSGVFNGASFWLGIGVCTNGGASFTSLSPRQQLTPTPYAIFAENAGGVNNASISATQLNAGTPASGQVLEYNGSSLQWTSLSGTSGAWSLTGNAGTLPGTNFLGTTDDEPLELWVDGARAFRLEPGGNVIGGTGNSVDPSVPGSATIAGGTGNTVAANSGNAPTIGGGQFNVVSNSESTVGGGEYNKALATAAVVGGGYGNIASGEAAMVPGGAQSTAAGSYSFAAGEFAQAEHAGAFVWADAEGSVFSSTTTNQFNVRANGGVRFVTGGAGLTIDGVQVGAGGGGGVGSTNGNTASGSGALSSVTSGTGNTADGYDALYFNTTGDDNTASGQMALYSNTNGSYNTASGDEALYSNTTGGGNTASGDEALYHNTTGSDNTAIGFGALGANNGGANNIAVGFQAGDNLLTGNDDIEIGNTGTGTGFSNSESEIIRIGTEGTHTACYLAGTVYANGTFVSSSDRNAKENLKPVDSREVLEKVAAMPVSRWNYKQDDKNDHIGPMAQDFYAAFEVGPDERHITTVDEGGVALAAIQGLNEKLNDKDAEIQELKQSVAELKQLVQSLAEKK